MDNNNILHKRLLETVSNAIQLALDDFDNDDNQHISKSAVLNQEDSRVMYQKSCGQTIITQKSFIHELLKRMPNTNKNLFKGFGFINYKVTGNNKDWPCIVSLNDNITDRTIEKYQDEFEYSKDWVSVQGTYTAFNPLMKILSNYYPRFREQDGPEHRGSEAFDYWNKENTYWYKSFDGKYNECVDALKKLAHYQPFLQKYSIINIYQISFSKDGAFCAIMFGWYDDLKLHRYANKIIVFCTDKIINDDNGLNVKEEKDISSAQRKLKANLKKASYENMFPKLLQPTIIDNNAAYKFSVISNIDLDWRLPSWQRTKDAREQMDKNMPYNEKTSEMMQFMRWITMQGFYIDRERDHYDLYETLKMNNNRPYVILSGKTGEFLIAYYNEYIEYRKYRITFMAINNSGFKYFPKEYFKNELQYNPAE